METVEHFAKIALVTHILGNEQPLGEKEVQKLQAVRHRYNEGGANQRSADDLESEIESQSEETAESRR
jgi:hypothetical protein